MRRPLKPFVTEYKGTRRPPQNQPSGFGSVQSGDAPAAGADAQGFAPRGPKSDGERPRSKPFETFGKPDSDDAYEAAMRAADALFARPGKPDTDRPDTDRPDTDRPDTDRPESEPTPAASAPTPAEQTDEATTSPERGGGRILRVIDEAPPPQFAALEAAYAPKRRGRKPGSKNKPKLTAPQLHTPAHSPYVTTNPASEPRAAHPPGEADVSTPTAGSSGATPALQSAEAIAVPADPQRSERRAPWSRDRLKPGEGWKRRRLPRVCW